MTEICSPQASAALQRWTEELQAEHGYATALIERRSGRRAFCDRFGPRLEFTPVEQGATLRVFNGFSLVECTTRDLSLAGIEALGRRTRDRAEVHKQDDKADFSFPAEGASDFSDKRFVPAETSNEEMLALVGSGQPRMAALASSSYSMARAEELRIEQRFVTPTRQYSQERVLRNSTYAAYFQKDGRQELFYAGDRRLDGWAVHTDEQWDTWKRQVAGLLNAKSVDPGFHDLVLTPDLSGILAHEAFGHGVESDMIARNRARSWDYREKSVGSSLVNISDTATVPGAAGTFAYDDEGQPATYTRILEGGIYKQPITDLYSGTRLGLAPTGNGRRESFDRKVYARMTNTFFEPAKSTRTPAEIIAGVDEGYYVERSGSGMEDPKGWGMQVQAKLMQRIRGGKLTGEYASPAVLTGYVPDLLASVSDVGSDFALNGMGHCGKGYKELVAVSFGGPTLRVRARLG